MIKVDTLKEYSTLAALKSYCKNCDSCKECKIKDICACFSISPNKFEIKFEKEETKNG